MVHKNEYSPAMNRNGSESARTIRRTTRRKKHMNAPMEQSSRKNQCCTSAAKGEILHSLAEGSVRKCSHSIRAELGGVGTGVTLTVAVAGAAGAGAGVVVGNNGAVCSSDSSVFS